MNLVKLMFVPLIKRFKKMWIALILISAIGITALLSMRSAQYSLVNNSNAYLKEYGYPDGYIQLSSPLNRAGISIAQEDLDRYGVEKYELRMNYDTIFTTQENKILSTRISTYTLNSIYKFTSREKSVNSYSNPIKIDYNFAKNNNIKLDSTIKVKYENEVREYKIEEIVSTPESLLIQENPYAATDDYHFGYLFIDTNSSEVFKGKTQFNEVLLKFKDGADVKSTFNTILLFLSTMISPSLVSLYWYGNNAPIRSSVNGTCSDLRVLTIILSSIFYVIMLIAIVLFLNQMIRQCRKDIGILRALGYSKGNIVSLFCCLSAIAGFISSAVGVGFSYLVGYFLLDGLNNSFFFPNMNFYINGLDYLIGVGISIGVSVLGALFASLLLTNIKPSEAMKSIPPYSTKTPFLVRTIFKKAPITLKIMISQSSRNIRRVIFTIFGMAACATMIIVAFSASLSKNEIIDQTFRYRINYDAQVFLKEKPTQTLYDQLNADPNISDYTLMEYYSAQITFKNNKTNRIINALDPSSSLIRIPSYNMKYEIHIPENGIILSSNIASRLGAVIGDNVTIGNVELKVVDISKQLLEQKQYISLNTSSLLEVADKRISIIAKTSNVDSLVQKCVDFGQFQSVTTTRALTEKYQIRFSGLDAATWILIAVSAILGFGIIFNMQQTNLKEQKNNLATLRTLGYQSSKISYSALTQLLMQYIIALCIGLPLGNFLTNYLLNIMSSTSRTYPNPISPLFYSVVCLIVLIFVLISHFGTIREMKYWDLPSLVKEKE